MLAAGAAGKALGAGEGEAGEVWGGNGQITRHGAYEVWHGGHYGVVRQGGGLRGVFAIGAAGGKAEQQTVQRWVEAAIHHGAEHGVKHLRGGLAGQLVGQCGALALGVALVAAGFADGGQHLAGDPFGELACLGFAAAQNKGVEAGFADDGELLFTTRGTHILRTLFVLI